MKIFTLCRPSTSFAHIHCLTKLLSNFSRCYRFFFSFRQRCSNRYDVTIELHAAISTIRYCCSWLFNLNRFECKAIENSMTSLNARPIEKLKKKKKQTTNKHFCTHKHVHSQRNGTNEHIQQHMGPLNACIYKRNMLFWCIQMLDIQFVYLCNPCLMRLLNHSFAWKFYLCKRFNNFLFDFSMLEYTTWMEPTSFSGSFWLTLHEEFL